MSVVVLKREWVLFGVVFTNSHPATSEVQWRSSSVVAPVEHDELDGGDEHEDDASADDVELDGGVALVAVRRLKSRVAETQRRRLHLRNLLANLVSGKHARDGSKWSRVPACFESLKRASAVLEVTFVSRRGCISAIRTKHASHVLVSCLSPHESKDVFPMKYEMHGWDADSLVLLLFC